MMPRDHQQPRQPIRAQTINHGVEARDMLDGISAAPGLEIFKGAKGLVLKLAMEIIGIKPAVTTGTVAGGSYSLPVSATVTLLKPNSSGGALSSSGMPGVTAYNCFSNATAIGSGKLVWLLNLWGRWYIIAADCS